MKRLNLTVFILFIALGVRAQLFNNDISGKAIPNRNETDINGFPFLYENWIKGSVHTENGKYYDKMLLRYDIAEDLIYFKSDNDESLRFVEPVNSFELELPITEKFKNGYPQIDNYTSLSYYQVLFKNDKLSLLLKKEKYISEIRPFNSAVTEKKFIENKSYYIFRDGKMEKFKPAKKDLISLFNDKSDLINSFITKSNIDFKVSTDIAKVFDFYYSLK